MLGPFGPLELVELLEHEDGWDVFTALEHLLHERHRPRRPTTFAERNAEQELLPVVPKAEGKAHGPRPKWRRPG